MSKSSFILSFLLNLIHRARSKVIPHFAPVANAFEDLVKGIPHRRTGLGGGGMIAGGNGRLIGRGQVMLLLCIGLDGRGYAI